MLTQRERALHKGLMKLLEEGSFTLKAREVAAFAEIYKWTKSLADIPPASNTIKPKKERKS